MNRLRAGPFSTREAAEKDDKRGWKFTLHAPSYMPVMQYADDRQLRQTMYRESATRASEFGKAEWDNTPLIARIVELRRELAQLLGYRNYAEVSLVPKMAESPEQVLGFLDDLAQRARPFAEKDVAELREFARRELGLDPLEAWDVAYASEKLRVQRYAFSEQEVRRYFPEGKVLEGLFRVAETLYGISIRASEAAILGANAEDVVRKRGSRKSAARLSGRLAGSLVADAVRAAAPSGSKPSSCGDWADAVPRAPRRPDGGQSRECTDPHITVACGCTGCSIVYFALL